LAVDARKIKKVKVHLKSGEKDFSSPFTDWYIFEKKK
jgi:hypothetical protein